MTTETLKKIIDEPEKNSLEPQIAVILSLSLSMLISSYHFFLFVFSFFYLYSVTAQFRLTLPGKRFIVTQPITYKKIIISANISQYPPFVTMSQRRSLIIVTYDSLIGRFLASVSDIATDNTSSCLQMGGYISANFSLICFGLTSTNKFRRYKYTMRMTYQLHVPFFPFLTLV